jgi:hypothetical protein
MRLYLLVLGFLLLFSSKSSAQLFFGIGAQHQTFSFSRDGSQGLQGVDQVVKLAGGDLSKVFPKRIRSTTLAPQVFIGWHFPQENNYYVRAQIATSQNFAQTFKLRGNVNVEGKNVPIPNAISLGIEMGRKFDNNTFLFGSITYDDGVRFSDYLLSQGTNLNRDAIDALNNISSRVNLLSGAGKGLFQVAVGGGYWLPSPSFDIRARGSVGAAGKALILNFGFWVELHKKNKKSLDLEKHPELWFRG